MITEEELNEADLWSNWKEKQERKAKWQKKQSKTQKLERQRRQQEYNKSQEGLMWVRKTDPNWLGADSPGYWWLPVSNSRICMFGYKFTPPPLPYPQPKNTMTQEEMRQYQEKLKQYQDKMFNPNYAEEQKQAEVAQQQRTTAGIRKMIDDGSILANIRTDSKENNLSWYNIKASGPYETGSTQDDIMKMLASVIRNQ